MNEKLTIRNFGPIKKLDIELKRVNILIGNEGTGKSTVAKLIAIFKDAEFLLDSKRPEFFKNFGIDKFFKANTYLKYECDFYTVEHERSGLVYKAEFDIQFNSISEDIDKYLKNKNEGTDKVFYQIRFENEIGQITYIPAERILSSISREIQLSWIASRSLNYLKRFIGQLETIKEDIKDRKVYFDVLSVSYLRDNGGEFIYREGTDNRLSLEEEASGVQSATPVLLVLNQYKNSSLRRRFLIVEEPELNLFPDTQNKFVKTIIEGMKKQDLGNSQHQLLMTTHSPYILATINNLMYAGKLNSDKARTIIDWFSWLNPNDVTALRMNKDGMYENLFDTELSLLKTEMIDNASNIINEEYHKLSLIEFPRK